MSTSAHSKESAVSHKRPPIKKSAKSSGTIYESMKSMCYDIGSVTLSLISGIPSAAAVLLSFIGKAFDALWRDICRLLKKIIHPFSVLFFKIGCALRAIKAKAGAAYKSGGIKAMFAAAANVFKEGFERNAREVRKLKNYIYPTIAIFFLATVVFVFTQLTFGLIVEYDGVNIGCIRQENVFDTAKSQLMQRVLYEKDDDEVDIVPKFRLAVVNKDSFLSSDQVTDKLIKASSSVISEASGLYIDNVLVGVVKEEDELEKALNSVLSKYATGEAGTTVAFVKDVQVKNGIYPTSSIVDISDLKAKISGNSASEVVYTVSKGDTPYEISRRTGISLASFYALNPITKSTFVVGQKVKIASSEPFLSVKVQKKLTVQETVAFKTVTTKNNNYYSSYSKVTRKGVNGVNQVTYLVTYLNGIATEKELIGTKVISLPVDEKVTVGTKLASTFVARDISASSGSGRSPGFMWPTSGRISCGWWGYYNHRGIDICAPKGTPIYAAASGTVITCKTISSGYGKHIIIDHGHGVQTLYAHTSAVYVKVGQKVSKGQLIAAVGRTGWATGNHLHFGVIINGVYKNPRNYLP